MVFVFEKNECRINLKYCLPISISSSVLFRIELGQEILQRVSVMQTSSHLLILILLVAGKTRGQLFSPFDHGVIGKVSEQFLQDLADEIATMISDLMQVRYSTFITLNFPWAKL